MNDTRYCWEQDATCETCRMELMENETIVFSLAQTNTMTVFALLISVLGSAINVLFLLSCECQGKEPANCPLHNLLAIEWSVVFYHLPTHAGQYLLLQADWVILQHFSSCFLHLSWSLHFEPDDADCEQDLHLVVTGEGREHDELLDEKGYYLPLLGSAIVFHDSTIVRIIREDRTEWIYSDLYSDGRWFGKKSGKYSH